MSPIGIIRVFVLLIVVLTVAYYIAKSSRREELDGTPKNCPAYSPPRMNITEDRIDDGDLYYDGSDCMRVAVSQLRYVKFSSFVATTDFNIDRLAVAADNAVKNGAKMIVFPEGAINSETYCLEEIPDPEKLRPGNNNPSLQPDLYKANPILSSLSYIARSNKLYVIANYGTREKCSSQNGDCNSDGFLALNTDVVLDPKGAFIKRYRKYNMFMDGFKRAPSVELVYFDVPHYGRFGLFTSFDLLFKDPAISLVEKHNIDTVIFPTFWHDELPILSAMQYQDGWSWRNRVNLLASNVLKPSDSAAGYGIFSGNDSIHVGLQCSTSQILIANIPPRYGGKCSKGFNPIKVDWREGPTSEYYVHLNANITSDVTATFDDFSGQKKACSGRVCCTVTYRVAKDTIKETLDRMILIAKDSNRQDIFGWREQACALAFYEYQNIDHPVFSAYSSVAFEFFSMNATFSTQYVYPYASHDVSHLVDRKKRAFDCDSANGIYTCHHQLVQSTGEPSPVKLQSFGMYARPYDEDR